MTEEDVTQNSIQDKPQEEAAQGMTAQKEANSTGSAASQETQPAAVRPSAGSSGTAQSSPKPPSATQSSVEPPGRRETSPARKPAGRPARRSSNRSSSRSSTSSRGSTTSAEQILPDGFQFGVATAGFQVEGGFNGPGEPANNWLWWEMAGKVEPSGIAVDFWNRYEEMLDLVAGMGCNAFRFGIEWARVEPRQGEIDKSALDRYVDIAKACKERGLEPLATLHHFTHPSWLGEDFWLMPDAPVMFSKWVELAAGRLKDHVSNWVTINEMNVIAMGSYLFGVMPPGRTGSIAEVATATDHLMAAHIKAYEIIHGLQPEANVTTNNTCVSIYEFDKMLIDVIAARSYGISRDDLDEWISERRQMWYNELPPPSVPEQLLRRISSRRSPVGATRRGKESRHEGRANRAREETLPSRLPYSQMAIDAVYSSPYEIALDFVGIDYYDPVATHHVVAPGHRTSGGRVWLPAKPLWEDPENPEGLITYCRANLLPGKPLWIVENGMCSRVHNGRAYPRLDSLKRPDYIRDNLAAMVDAIDAGIPVGGYFHWTLADNYEWGSYQPRFGIYGVDRERGTKIMPTDAAGLDAAGAYGNIIRGLRQGDRSVLHPR